MVHQFGVDIIPHYILLSSCAIINYLSKWVLIMHNFNREFKGMVWSMVRIWFVWTGISLGFMMAYGCLCDFPRSNPRPQHNVHEISMLDMFFYMICQWFPGHFDGFFYIWFPGHDEASLGLTLKTNPGPSQGTGTLVACGSSCNTSLLWKITIFNGYHLVI